jgi:hypothetical protein
MTHAQIIGELVIGFFLLVIGIVLQPLLKMLWKRVNTPSPLTPQSKGQLVTAIATAEYSLDRINYLDAHPRDLFLYLIQLTLSALFCAFVAIFLYLFRLLILARPLIDVFQLGCVVFFAFAILLSLLGFIEAGRMSRKKIEITKQRIQEQIDGLNKRLNPPA